MYLFSSAILQNQSSLCKSIVVFWPRTNQRPAASCRHEMNPSAVVEFLVGILLWPQNKDTDTVVTVVTVSAFEAVFTVMTDMASVLVVTIVVQSIVLLILFPQSNDTETVPTVVMVVHMKFTIICVSIHSTGHVA